MDLWGAETFRNAWLRFKNQEMSMKRKFQISPVSKKIRRGDRWAIFPLGSNGWNPRLSPAYGSGPHGALLHRTQPASLTDDLARLPLGGL